MDNGNLRQSRSHCNNCQSDNSEILGRYNPLEWKFDNCHGTTKDSSFNDGIKNYILSHVIEKQNAIFNRRFVIMI